MLINLEFSNDLKQIGIHEGGTTKDRIGTNMIKTSNLPKRERLEMKKKLEERIDLAGMIIEIEKTTKREMIETIEMINTIETRNRIEIIEIIPRNSMMNLKIKKEKSDKVSF